MTLAKDFESSLEAVRKVTEEQVSNNKQKKWMFA